MPHHCHNHPDHIAIESCEVCEKPLCALCLWYTVDGHRLCEEHAREQMEKGVEVLSPDTYREALAGSLLRGKPADADPDENRSHKVYRGNSYDLSALAATIIGLVTLASCFGGAYCLPFAGFLLGLVVYLNADQAIDTRRTKNLALAGMGFSGFLLLLVAAIFLFYFMIVFLVVITGGGP